MAPKTSHVSLFVPRDLREALERLAARHDRSLSAEIRTAIRAYTAAPSPQQQLADLGEHQPPLGPGERHPSARGPGEAS